MQAYEKVGNNGIGLAQTMVPRIIQAGSQLRAAEEEARAAFHLQTGDAIISQARKRGVFPQPFPRRV